MAGDVGICRALLVIPLPLQALAFMMGGVSPGEWIGAVVLQLGAMILGSALGRWGSARSERVCTRHEPGLPVRRLFVPAPVGIGLANLSLGMWFTTALGVACAALAILPFAGAGAELLSKYLPLDAVRPTALDSSQSSAYAEGQTLLGGEKPSAPLSATDQARLEVLRESEHPASRAARLREGDAEIPRREVVGFRWPRRAASGDSSLAPARAACERASAVLRCVDAAVGGAVPAGAPCLGRHARRIWRGLLGAGARGAAVDSRAAQRALWARRGLPPVSASRGCSKGCCSRLDVAALDCGGQGGRAHLAGFAHGRVAAGALRGLVAGLEPGTRHSHGGHRVAGCGVLRVAGRGLRDVAFVLVPHLVGVGDGLAGFVHGVAGHARHAEQHRAARLPKTPARLSGTPGCGIRWASSMAHSHSARRACSMCAMMLAASVAMLAHITITRRRKALEREGRSLLHADLTRNLH